MPSPSSTRPLPLPPRPISSTPSLSPVMKPLPPTPTPTLPSPPGRRTPTTILALASLLLFLFLSLSLLSTLLSSNPSAPLQQTTKHPVRFTDYHTFTSPLDSSIDTAWSTILPPNGGFVYREDSTTGERRMWGISMFHQLHCLQLIREKLLELDPQSESSSSSTTTTTNKDASPLLLRSRSSSPSAQSSEVDPKKQNTNTHTHMQTQMHWTHCIDYLRQSVLCAADDTMESPIRQPDGRDIVDANSEHMCFDRRRLWDMSVASGFGNETAGPETE